MGRLAVFISSFFASWPSTRKLLKDPAGVLKAAVKHLGEILDRHPDNAWKVFKEVLAVLRPAWFAWLITVAISVALPLVGQTRDTLADIAGEAGVLRALGSSQPWSLLVFGLAFAAAAWYFPRALLYVRYPYTPESSKEAFEPLRRWFPRLLGVLPLLAVAATFAANRSWKFAGLYLLVALVFLRVLVVRRYLLFGATEHKVYLHENLRDWKSGRLKPLYWVLFWLLLSLIGLVTFLASEVRVPELLGPMGIVFAAAAMWIAFVSMILIYPAHIYTWPSLVVILLVLGAFFSAFNDNHAVRHLGTVPTERVSVAEHLQRWVDHRSVSWSERFPSEPMPIFVAAAEGGGIRAAYWTAGVLARLEEEVPGFGCQLFAISGVSGGSLGASVFAALMADRAEAGFTCNNPEKWKSSLPFLATAKSVLGHDFLAPDVAGLLFPDLIQRFWPLPNPLAFPDRARYLERSWEEGWRRGTVNWQEQLRKQGENRRFAEDFLRLWYRDGGGPSPDVPSLFLNGTWVETGGRVVTSNLRPEASAFVRLDDFFAAHERAVRLSTAAHNSARFPYVSPAGTVGGGDRHIVDGGYFENSGAETAAEILRLIRDACPDNVCPEEECQEEPCGIEVAPVALVITNSDPSGSEPASLGWLVETLTPVKSLLATRQARGRQAEAALQREWPTCRMSLPRVRDQEVPLGWMLSATTREGIDGELDWVPPEELDLLTFLRGKSCRAPG